MAATATGERTLQVEIRSPDGPIWSGPAEMVVAPGSAGSLGILPRHAALTTSLDFGLTRVKEPGGKERRFVTGAGFLEVVDDVVLILVDSGEEPGKIDVKRAKEAEERARARLKTREENIDQVRAEAALQRALVRLRFAGETRL